MAGVTAAQVRRDLMHIGATGSPITGYDIAKLVDCVAGVLDDPTGQRAALVGVGHLGQAILTFFAGRRPKLSITAAFDIDPAKVDRVIAGCRCYPTSRLAELTTAEGITVGIIATPATEAQQVAECLEAAGVTGILNFAPTRLRVGPTVFVEDIDITMALERVAYFARASAPANKESGT
jgi:redox-sensing transcriptional repressor